MDNSAEQVIRERDTGPARTDITYTPDHPRDYPQTLTAIWPIVHPRIARHLRTLGTNPTDADDIAQTIALRAIERQIPFTDADDFMRWAGTVGRNLRLDNHRRALRHDPTTPPDHPDWHDVARDVAARIDLTHIATLLLDLTPGDRALLLPQDDDHTHTPAERNRRAVRRHRLRQRLLLSLDLAEP